jgi:hypothetical protein
MLKRPRTDVKHGVYCNATILLRDDIGRTGATGDFSQSSQNVLP